MNRLLLTLLALLTGLAAQVSPAAATTRSGGETEIGMAKTQLTRRVEATVVIAMVQASQVQTPAAVAPSAPTAAPAPRVRTVLTGIDRARE